MGGCISSDHESSNDLRKRKNIGRDEFDGPVRSRECTDTPMLIFFILFLALWIGLVTYCVGYGDLRRIYNGYDDYGNICGVNNIKLFDQDSPYYSLSGKDMTNKKYMLIFPRDSWNSQKRQCVNLCSNTSTVKTREFLGRCYPEDENILADVLTSYDIQEFFEKAATDIALTYGTTIILCLTALVFSVILIILFRYFAGILVWFVLICVSVVSIGVTVYSWLYWRQKKAEAKSEQDDSASKYFVYACICTLGMVILLLLIFGVRKSINLVAQLFYESGKAVQAMPLVMIQPFITFIAVMILLLVWVTCFIYIESSGHAQPKVGATAKPPRLTFKKDEFIQLARVVNCLGAFWLIQFLIGCQHMVIAGSVSTWFFTRKKSNLSSPISQSYGYLFGYHLGSVAFGSLVIAVVQIIRYIFSLIKSSVKDPKNSVSEFFYNCFKCIFYCLEKILVFLTRNAYIEIAIYGDNLCTSGKRAFHVLVNNSLRVTAINSVGDFVLFLGKVLIVASTVFIGHKMLENKNGLNYPALPLFIAGIFAYLVSHAFMTAFEMIIDTIFICFCEDCEMNDGDENPYYMSKDLMEFVEKSQKVLKVGDGAGQPRSQTARWLREED